MLREDFQIMNIIKKILKTNRLILQESLEGYTISNFAVPIVHENRRYDSKRINGE
jgi:hypothetical protein